MWLPKGTALRLRLQDFLRRIQTRYDYQEVITPPIGNKLLYVTSGHYAKYGKDAFQPIHTPEEGEEYFLKPKFIRISRVRIRICLYVLPNSELFVGTSRVVSFTG